MLTKRDTLRRARRYAGERIAGDYDVIVVNGLNAEQGGDLSPDELAALDTFVRRRALCCSPTCNTRPCRRAAQTALDWVRQRFGIVVGDNNHFQNRSAWAKSLMSDADATSVFASYDRT